MNRDTSLELDHLLMQVAEMIQKIQNHKGPIPENITPRILEEIDRLEKELALFNEANQKAWQAANIDIGRLQVETLRSPDVSTKDKRLLQRAKNIERDARSLQLSYSKALERGKGKKAKVANKQKMKERRKLFKPLGGDKNWIPL